MVSVLVTMFDFQVGIAFQDITSARNLTIFNQEDLLNCALRIHHQQQQVQELQQKLHPHQQHHLHNQPVLLTATILWKKVDVSLTPNRPKRSPITITGVTVTTTHITIMDTTDTTDTTTTMDTDIFMLARL